MSEKINKESAELGEADLWKVTGGIGVWMKCKKDVAAYNQVTANQLNQCVEFQHGNGIATTEHSCKNCSWWVPRS